MTFVTYGGTFMLEKISKWMQKNEPTSLDQWGIDLSRVPFHVAIIMDGNGRWAKKRGLPRISGHQAGMKKVIEITRAADQIGVKVLTLYAFSTENWKRPPEEVEFLMKLPQEFLGSELDELIDKNIQVRMLGDENQLPAYTIKAVKKAMEKTKDNTGMVLNFALNYGSRAEMVDAIKQIAIDVKNQQISPDEINESTMDSYLLTKEYPDPDLLIRTSGELRLSNFMLWQLAYSELWFTDVLWPDFKHENFFEAIREYQNRSRRFGALK